jgi:hypothetical protein
LFTKIWSSSITFKTAGSLLKIHAAMISGIWGIFLDFFLQTLSIQVHREKTQEEYHIL